MKGSIWNDLEQYDQTPDNFLFIHNNFIFFGQYDDIKEEWVHILVPLKVVR